MTPNIIILDDESSVAFNVAHAIAALGWNPKVCPLPDATQLDELTPTHLVFVTSQSPALSQPIIDALVAKRLGHTALIGIGQGGLALGTALGLAVPSERPINPALVEVCHDGCLAFGNLSYRFRAWAPRLPRLGREALPECLEMTATTPTGLLLGFRHRTHACEGVLFQPESSGTPDGLQWFANVFGVRS
ncbi:MAG: glutamine amidotransferase-related protein [Acidobacteriota bacterium]